MNQVQGFVRRRRPRRGARIRFLAAAMAIAAGACGERTDPNGAVGSPAPAARSTAAAASAPNHAIYAANGIACATCHPCGERSPGGHGAPWMDAASSGFHAYAANAGLSACQACHGTGLDGAGGTTAVSCAMCHGAGWRTSCTGCHGGTDGTSGAPPRATWGNSADAIRVGAHTAHLAAAHGLSKPVECASCHVVPPDALSAGHVDGPTATVAFSGLATAAGALPTWSRAAASCASTYCHGATLSGGAVAAPVWTLQDGTQRACGACHGAPPPPPHVASTDCGACHAGYGPSTVVAATHVDGKLDVVALSCNSCHGSAANAAPPYGTRGEVSTTTVAVGAHQRHLAGGPVSRPVACSECHVEPASMRHADGSVQLAFGPLATTDASPATWDPTSLTCTNYCHGAILRGGGTNLAPLWTGGPSQVTCGSCHQTPPPAPHPHTQVCENCHPGYTVTSVNQATHVNGLVEAENLTCASCHGDTSRVLVMQADPLAVAAPPYGTRGETDPASRSVGQHQAHVNRGDGLALPNKCRYCHAVPTTFDHADGVSLVTFGSLATMDGAAPTFDGSTCSNTYCHGSTLGRGGTGHSPTWTTPAAVTCGSCHGVPPPLPHPQDSDCIRCHPGYTSTSVRKWTHVNGISDFPSGCNSCHDIPPNSGAHYEHLHERVACDRCHAGYTTTAANETLHRNARQDVTLAGWNPSTRTCSGIGCHGSEYWGRTGTAARQSCNQCHGVPPRSGEHYEHSEYACSRCHGTGYTTTTTNAATHMSGTVDVPFAFYDRTTHTCTSTGCHGTQRWGTPVPVVPNCSNCHGFPPPLPHPQDSACQSCHPSMLATGVLTADHNNGTLDISGQGCQSCHGFPPTSTRKGAIHPTDANCYGCHSTTVDASNQIVPNGTHNDGYVQVGGGGVGTYGCQTCHGDQARQAPAGADANVKAAPPLGTRGESEPTTRAVGAHLAHVSPAAGTLAGPAACAECHPVPTAMDHAGGTVLIAFGGRATLQGATPAYDPAAVTCSSTYCHGSTLGAGGTRHAPTWTGGAAEAACGTCHGAPPPEPHVQSVNCGGCHEGYTASSVNLTQHVNGSVEITAMACNSCHGNAQNAAPPLGTLGETLTTQRAVGAHQAHLAGGTLSGPIACGECHLVPTALNHRDGAVQLAWGPLATAGGATAAWDPAALTCASYCHGQFAGGNALNAPAWTVVNGTQAACGTCHGAPPPPPHGTNTSCGSCHDGYTQTSVNLATHVNGTVEARASPHPAGWADRSQHGTQVNLGGLSPCRTCHGDLGPTTSCGTCHATAGSASWDTSCTFCHGSTATGSQNPPVDIRGASSTANVSVGAHESHATTTIATALSCAQCHPARTASVLADAAHVDGNGIAEVAFGTLAKTGGAPATYTRVSGTSATCASTYCHGKFSGGVNSGNGATMGWTSTTQVTCTSCHGSPPSTGRHSKHSGSSFGCYNCHNSVVSSSNGVVDKTLHVNGVDDVKFGGTYNSRTVSGTWNATSRSCSSLSCHGSESW